MPEAYPRGAELIVRLYEIRLTDPYRSAAHWFLGDFSAASWAEIEERWPKGSRESEALRTVLEHWDLLGALTHGGAIDQALLFESTGDHLAVWTKLEPWIHDARHALADPALFENIELLVNQHERYARTRAPRLARRAEGTVGTS